MKRIILLVLLMVVSMSEGNVWEESYQNHPVEELGWHYPTLDPHIEEILRGVDGQRLVDFGCGAGIQSIELAKRGFEVTGVDVSSTAVAGAKKRAAKGKSRAQFVQSDLGKSNAINGPFDVAIDRACFHCLSPEAWPTYLENLDNILEPGGHFILICYRNDNGKRNDGECPHYFTPPEIDSLFSDRFAIRSLTPITFNCSYKPAPPAFIIVMQKM